VKSEALTTDLVFGLVESVLTWFEREGSAQPHDVASAIAHAVLAIVGVSPGDAARAERASARLRERFCDDHRIEGTEADRLC